MCKIFIFLRRRKRQVRKAKVCSMCHSCTIVSRIWADQERRRLEKIYFSLWYFYPQDICISRGGRVKKGSAIWYCEALQHLLLSGMFPNWRRRSYTPPPIFLYYQEICWICLTLFFIWRVCVHPQYVYYDRFQQSFSGTNLLGDQRWACPYPTQCPSLFLSMKLSSTVPSHYH